MAMRTTVSKYLKRVVTTVIVLLLLFSGIMPQQQHQQQPTTQQQRRRRRNVRVKSVGLHESSAADEQVYEPGATLGSSSFCGVESSSKRRRREGRKLAAVLMGIITAILGRGGCTDQQIVRCKGKKRQILESLNVKKKEVKTTEVGGGCFSLGITAVSYDCCEYNELGWSQTDKIKHISNIQAESFGTVVNGKFVLHEDAEDYALRTNIRKDDEEEMRDLRYSYDGSPSIWSHTVSVQGLSHTTNEDRYLRPVSQSGLGTIFGVFDGHRGPECSEFIRKRIAEAIGEAWRRAITPDEIRII
eukprot:jgi/Bigna1/76076/fgenesh1_pg.39_\